jgi:hypothetical protein
MEHKYTFDELVLMIAQTLENPAEASINKGMEREVAKGLSEVVGLKDFLKETMSADMRRYFAASEAEQPNIKGAFSRTVYLLGLARSGGDLRTK